MSQTFTVSVPKLKQQLLVDAAADAAINQAVKYFSLHRYQIMKNLVIAFQLQLDFHVPL